MQATVRSRIDGIFVQFAYFQAFHNIYGLYLASLEIWEQVIDEDTNLHVMWRPLPEIPERFYQ